MEKLIKEFLEKDFNKITISNHVSGYRISLHNMHYGEIISKVCSEFHNFSYSIIKCIEDFENSLREKELKHLEELKKKKKELQKELEEISFEINSKSLKEFVKVG